MKVAAPAGSRSRGLAGWLAFCVLLAGILCPLSASTAESVAPSGPCGGAWLGVTLDPSWVAGGARIVEVDLDGPAALAGLLAGDIVSKAGGVLVHNADDLARWSAGVLPGDTAVFALSRDGRAGRVSIELWGVPRAVCYMRLADQTLAREDLVLAERYLRAAIDQQARLRLAWERLAEVLRRQNRPAESAEAARRAAEATAPEAPVTEVPDRVLAKTGGEPVRSDALDAARTATVAASVGTGRADGLKAMVALGGFQVKAAGASEAIGDGLREMLISALHQSGYFVVVERADLRGLRVEQDLSRSATELPSAAMAQAMDIADIMVFGAVTEFEPAAGGSSFMTPMMGMPLAIGAQIKWSQMALDVRVVDVRTARVLGAQRIPGMARSAQGTIAGALPIGPVSVPAGLSVYRNTPMEWAVRDCLRKSTYFVINSIDEDYFRHR